MANVKPSQGESQLHVVLLHDLGYRGATKAAMSAIRKETTEIGVRSVAQAISRLRSTKRLTVIDGILRAL